MQLGFGYQHLSQTHPAMPDTLDAVAHWLHRMLFLDASGPGAKCTDMY